MPSQAVFLSLWYISSLPLSLSTTGLLRDEQGYSFLWHLQGDLLPNPDLEVLISRLFLVGAMLADKWLDDLTVITKSWSRLSHIPITTLNNLEWAALQIFGYSLHISPSSWSAWLHKLLDYHSSVARLYPVSRARDSGYTLICNCLGQALEACRVGPLVTSPPAPSATPPPMMCVQEDITRLGQPHFLPPPATWSPNDDPIFIAPKRKVGMAPGTIPIQRSAGAHVQPSSINRDPLADHLGVVLIDGIQHPTDAFTFGLPLLSQPISWLRGRP
ncbi:hypothetical protein JAAARDRAFT_118943 [Jaapia argillacea MUCL 33604]|uniref:Cyclin N-terminal domain-containing protein n=1 Tax=Jaapia argillacea MUCL 33604 TaxID=933084 RepID=A0A067QCI0_9AGAM|nr:hypothetical protein JAAARDRAFT_118943 [Jaapia argillacea MUCL 33604]